MDQTPVLLLSGAGLPAWIWDEVRAALPVESRVAPRTAEGGPADHARAALASVTDWPACHVVAHSIGGAVAAAMAALDPQRVTAVTGVSAVVPAAGSSFVGALPRPQRYVMGGIVRLVGTRPPQKVLRSGLCAGLDDALADRLLTDFAPESRALYLDRVPPHRWPTRTAYVSTTRDREIPPELQEEYAARLGAAARPITTGHLPMLERPAELAVLISG